MENKICEEYDKLMNENSKIKNSTLFNSEKISAKTWMLIIGICIIMLFLLIKISLLFVVGIVILISLYNKKVKQFEKEIIMALVQKLENIDEVDISKGIPHEIYRKANFRQGRYENYNTSHYIKGHLDNAEIQMSKVETTTKYRDADGDIQTKTVFKGLLVVAELKENIIDGFLHIFNDKDDSKILKFNQAETKVNMDSTIFEKEFDVYSTEPIKALEILTADVMEKMIAEKQKIKCKYDISITENMIIMRILGKEDILKARYNKKAKSNSYKEELKDVVVNDVMFVHYIYNLMNDFANDIYSKK